MAEPLTIVIEGIGDVVQKYYLEVLEREKKNRKNDIRIIFADDATYWRNDPQLSVKMKQCVSDISQWATYIDKSTPEGKRDYRKLSVDIVLIATPEYTHIDIATRWLKNPNRCKKVFVEKPLDSRISKIRDLLGVIDRDDPKIRALDHYCVRALPLGPTLQRSHILKDLGGRITSFDFYFLENGSGGGAVGPIEKEKRTKALKNGLLLDLMPHVIAVLSFVGKPETIRVHSVRAGRYKYYKREDGKDVLKSAGIKKETFAHVKFSLFDHKQNDPPIIGNAYVGKGIKGVDKLNMKGEVKLLSMLGKNGKVALFDFRKTGAGSSRAWLVYKDGTRKPIDWQLELRPYDLIISSIIRQALDDETLTLDFVLPIETAYSTIISIDEMRHPLKKRITLPDYFIGHGGDEAPVLEELIQGDNALPILYGK